MTFASNRDGCPLGCPLSLVPELSSVPIIVPSLGLTLCPYPDYRAFTFIMSSLRVPLSPLPGLSRGNNRESRRRREAIAEGPVTDLGPPPRTRRGPDDDHSLHKRAVEPPRRRVAAATASTASCLGKRGAALPSAVDSSTDETFPRRKLLSSM